MIRLKDGRLLFGKVISTVGSNVTIKMRDGKWIHVDVADIAPKPEAISTNPVVP